ncbi:MAG: esterase family protein, partial [Alteraurantiacibacter sp.]|nr:esterase family protein [Alteraurantiacibacter sp.]
MLRSLAVAATLALGVAGAALALPVPAAAQEQARAAFMTFHSPALVGNLEGNSAERRVLVVTPPGYDENPSARYPVVYFLHGYWGQLEAQQAAFQLHEAVQASAAAGYPFIMVMPDGYSRLRGGFYSSGPTVGDYEGMVARDLVAWVDRTFRTIPSAASRGLAGHSMGGYGTIRVAMKNPGVFSSIYMMSACCLPPMELTAEQARAIETMTPEQAEAAQFGQLASVSTAATWSPDPTAANSFKIYTGLREDGTLDPLVNQRLAANSPLVLVPQYLGALNGLEGFAIDIG